MRRAFDETAEPSTAVALTTPVRTWYGCAAHGCPNAAAIDDDGARNPGKCYWHWRAPAHTWPAVTQEILDNFDFMRNHGVKSPELQAKHRAEAQVRFQKDRVIVSGPTS